MVRLLFSSRTDTSDKVPSATLSSSDCSHASIDWISELLLKEHHNKPQVITLTFHRASTEQRLGVKLGKRIKDDNVSGENDSSDVVYVVALDKRHDSLLNNPAIQVGDIVVSFNDTICGTIDLDELQETMSKAIGVITIRLVKSDAFHGGLQVNSATSTCDENRESGQQTMVVHQAVFFQPNAHTCLPMDLDFESHIVSKQRCLTIVSINSTRGEEENNSGNWLSRSCLQPGQIILDINGSSSYNLEEDDARVFLHTKCELEPFVSITTLGYPSRNHAGQLQNHDDIRTDGKENEPSESTGSDRKRFPSKWISPAKSNSTSMWSLRQNVSKEEEERKEQKKLDAQYIQTSTTQIQELLREAKKDHTVDSAAKLPMFTSCRKLFVGMKHRMDACTRERGTAEVYYQLYLSLNDFLSQYAQILQSTLNSASPSKKLSSSRFFNVAKRTSSSPTSTSSPMSSSSSFSSLKGSDHLFGHDERIQDNESMLCHIINTSKFCSETIEQMEETIRSTIDSPYVARIDTSFQQEAFDEIAAKAMEFLVLLLAKSLQKSAFSEMGKLSWKHWDHVEDTNDYVYSICHQVEQYLATAEQLLSPAYFCTLCDKVAMDIVESIDSIMLLKCNQATTAGKQQLLLDVHTLKSFFLGKLVQDHKKGALVSSWAIYEKMVSEKFQKMEALLRVASVSEYDLKDFMDDVI